MKKIFLFAVLVYMFCSISAQESMFPSIIMNSKINSTDSNNYKNPAYKFHITSIDWNKKTVTIDKNIILPKEQNMPNAQYWQMFGIGMDEAYPNQLIQLTSQISPNSFKFNVLTSQERTIKGGKILTLEIVNPGSRYTDQDVLYIINPNITSGTYVSVISIAIDESGNKTIEGFTDNGDGFNAGQVYATNYSNKIPFNPSQQGTGDNNLTIRVLTVTEHSYTPHPDFINNFFDNTAVGFRNPQQAWIPLSLTEITESPKVYPNHFVDYISRYNNQFIALIDYNPATEPNRFGIVHSDDFVNWDYITPITPVSIDTLPSWMNPNLLNIGLGMCTNNVNGNVHTLTFNQAYTTPYNKGRAGICTTSDFINYKFSKTYFTCRAIADDNTVSWNKVSYCLFKGKYYITADITLNNDPSQRRCYLFTWGGDTSNMTLKLVQKIGDNKPKYCWNYKFTANPNMFVANNKLYMFCEGADGVESYEYGNDENCDGLFIFNESTGLFEEYFSNPIITNVELDNNYQSYIDHQDILCVYQYNSKLYAMMCMTAGGANTYQIFPTLLCMKNKKMVDDWLNKTTGLK